MPPSKFFSQTPGSSGSCMCSRFPSPCCIQAQCHNAFLPVSVHIVLPPHLPGCSLNIRGAGVDIKFGTKISMQFVRLNKKSLVCWLSKITVSENTGYVDILLNVTFHYRWKNRVKKGVLSPPGQCSDHPGHCHHLPDVYIVFSGETNSTGRATDQKVFVHLNTLADY